MRNYTLILSLIIALSFNHAAMSKPKQATAESDVLRQTSKAFASIARQAIPAVVFIKVEKTITQQGHQGGINPQDLLEQFFGLRSPRQYPEQRFKQSASGTGFFISKDGYILTNNHVVDGADSISVRLHDGQTFKATLIGSDPRSEVALIKIAGEKDFPVLTIGDSDAIDIGEWVIAIGNPFGLSETLTVGIVSAKGRSNIGITDYEDFIQTDAAINPGNSGGPLLNIDGEVIGINTAIFSQMGGSLGIGFAIPINMAMKIKAQLQDSGTVTRGFLGVLHQDLDQNLAKSFNYPKTHGVLISEVVKDSAADKAGIKVEDIIYELNGKPIENTSTFRNQIALTPPGTKIKLTIWRSGKSREITAEVGSQDVAYAAGNAQPAILGQIGIEIDSLSEEWAQRFGYPMDSGVLVTKVNPESPAAQAGIQPGNLIMSVNKREVKNIKDFNHVMAHAANSKMILFLVRSTHSVRFVTISLE